MITKFTAVVAGQEFLFDPVNILKLRNFRVYTRYEDRNRRFHLQAEKPGDMFMITDGDACPAAFRDLEPEFSRAIYERFPLRATENKQ